MAVERVTSSKRDREKAKQSKREEKQKRKEERLSSGCLLYTSICKYIQYYAPDVGKYVYRESCRQHRPLA